MKRYMLFGFICCDNDYIKNFIGDFDSICDAIDFTELKNYDIYQIFDLHKQKIFAWFE